MTSQSDDITIVIPTGSQMYWFGADENPTRTGSDAQTSWAQVSYLLLLLTDDIRLPFERNLA